MLGARPSTMSGRPQSAMPRMNAGLRRRAPVRPHSTKRADQRAHAERRVEVADARVAEIEQLDRDDDDVDHHEARHERLRREQADEHAQRLVSPDDREACEALAEDRRGLDLALRRRRLDLDPQDEERGQREHGSGEPEDDLEVGDGEQQAGHGRPEEEREALDRARDGVRGRQLARRPRERRRERGLRGAERRVRNRCRDREGVDDRRGDVGGHAERGAGDEQAAHERGGEEHALPPVAVGEHARERRHDGCRHEPQQEDEARPPPPRPGRTRRRRRRRGSPSG